MVWHCTGIMLVLSVTSFENIFCATNITSPGATTTSPGATTTSPGATTTSPGATTASPGATTTLPGATTASPGVTTASSGATTASPGATTASPGATTASPGAETGAASSVAETGISSPVIETGSASTVAETGSGNNDSCVEHTQPNTGYEELTHELKDIKKKLDDLSTNQNLLLEKQRQSSCEPSNDNSTIYVLNQLSELKEEIKLKNEELSQLQQKYDKVNTIYLNVSLAKNDLEEQVKNLTATLNATLNRTRTMGAADCSEVLSLDFKQNDVYIIYPKTPSKGVSAYCDQETDGGGWTVFLTRKESYPQQEKFNRTWQEYSEGFGDPKGEYWLGNKVLHALTGKTSTYMLRMDVQYETRESLLFAEWDYFTVNTEDNKYSLLLGDYNPNSTILTNPLHYEDGMAFSTFDQDNDRNSLKSCSKTNGGGGWWWNNCNKAHLTRPFIQRDQPDTADTSGGSSEDLFNNNFVYLQLKIRPKI